MAHQYKVGDIIRIKERKGAYSDYPYCFGDSMSKLAGTICKIEKIIPVSAFIYPDSKYINDDYHRYEIKPINPSDYRDFVWAWHSSMFEPFFSEPQTSTSLKEGDLLSICGIIGRIRDDSENEYYLEFDHIADRQGHFDCCKKLRKLVPNFDKIANECGSVRDEFALFPEFSTIDGLVKFVQAINSAYECKKSITTTKTLNENEIKFQKPKATFSRGSVPKGNPICGRKHKTAIVIGHLSNQEISC